MEYGISFVGREFNATVDALVVEAAGNYKK